VKGRRIAFAILAWLFLAGVVVQVFLAGVGLFELADWTLHADVGWGLGSAPLLLLLFVFAARFERRTVLLTAGLALAAVIQPELAAARHTAPIVAAFHPLNALVVFWLAWLVAQRSLELVRATSPDAEAGKAVEPTEAA
jgi:hypothetical protein